MDDEDVHVRTERVYCRNTTDDGRVCSLYKDHYGPNHKENHGKSTWPVEDNKEKN